MREEEKMDSANEGALLCDMSSARSDVCELKGDIRVILSNATIILLHPSSSVRRRSLKLKPHTRKNDRHMIAGITEVSVLVSSSSTHALGCTSESAATAVVFSVGGYAGNMFHDFTDVLGPLFITTRWFHGDVHLLVSDAPPWWVDKYRPLLRGLSHHAIIDMNMKSVDVLCHPHMIVGLSFPRSVRHLCGFGATSLRGASRWALEYLVSSLFWARRGVGVGHSVCGLASRALGCTRLGILEPHTFG
jgi:hypothetical protein